MNSLFDRLNLKPSERRLMIVMMIILFALLNIWFVFPHFREREIIKSDIANKKLRLQEFQLEANRIPDLQMQLQQVEARIGTNTLVEASASQTSDFQRRVDLMQEETGMRITRQSGIAETLQLAGTTNTNKFFTDLSMTIDFNSGEKELVEFIYQISSGDSRIRVSDLTIRPVANQMSLNGRITLVSSFRKDSSKASDASVSRP